MLDGALKWQIKVLRMLRRKHVARTWSNEYNIQDPQMLYENLIIFKLIPVTWSHFLSCKRKNRSSAVLSYEIPLKVAPNSLKIPIFDIQSQLHH